MKIKKQKAQKIFSKKENLNLKIVSNCLKATLFENVIEHLEKNPNWHR